MCVISKRNIVLLIREICAILHTWETIEPKAALPLLLFCGGYNSPPDERKEGDAMITYSELIQTGIFIVALVSLCYTIFKGRK